MSRTITRLLIAACCAVNTLQAADPEAKAPPNIVIVIGDDISAADFGCYGHPTIKTPNIDGLATHGIRFGNAYLTAPSCSPSRTSLLTGRYPHNTGGPELHMKKNPHLAKLAQFPHLMRQAGYYTALAGKAHFNGDYKPSFDQVYPGGTTGSERWLTALKERPKDKPFLMWMAAIDAHRPWDMDLADGPHGPDDADVPPYLVDGQGTRTDLAHYYDEIHRFDANIGKVLAELKTQQVLDNTVIVVMADNGRPFPRCKTWIFDGGIKTPLVIVWPERIKAAATCNALVSSIDIAPTILEIVGLPVPNSVQGVSLLPLIDDPAGSVRDVVFAERNWHVYRHHDRLARRGNYTYIKNNATRFMGFNAHRACAEPPHEFNGKSASADLIEGFWKRTLTDAQRFVTLEPAPDELLFDVSKDPHQIHNLAGDPRYAAQLKSMRELLAQWTKQTGDTVPPYDKMTPDRTHRETGVSIQRKGRPPGGIVPGEETRAWEIHHPGPIRVKEAP